MKIIIKFRISKEAHFVEIPFRRVEKRFGFTFLKDWINLADKLLQISPSSLQSGGEG